MTAEKTIYIASRLLTFSDAPEDIKNSVLSNPSQFIGCGEVGLIAELLHDARLALAKRSSSGLPVLKRIVKNAPNDSLRGCWISDGKTVFCDGYLCFRLNDLYSEISRAFPPCAGIDVSRFFPAELPARRVDLPAVAELKAYAAQNGDKRGKFPVKPYELAPRVYVNPFFLIDAMEVLPGCGCFIDPETPERFYIKPIIFQADNGDGLLMPVRP